MLAEQEVVSYAIYETLGLFDLFFRAWLPSQSHERVEHALNDALQGEYLQLLESFTVNRVLRHHVWDDGEEGLLEPEAEELQRHLSDGEIDAVNEGTLTSAQVADLTKRKIIAQLEPDPGIKFFMVITSPVFSTTFGARKKLENNLLECLSKSRIREESLYEGSGFGHFILMGRAKPDDFFAIPHLAIEINNLGLYEAFIARPYTHVCGREEMLAFDERIPTSKREEHVDVRAMLERPESRVLEVKGSLRLHWHRWLFSRESVELESADEVLDEGVLKAVVGMLNADGGQVLVGALERSRVPRRQDVLDERFSGFEQIGEYIVVGVDREEKFKSGGWDAFRLQIQELLTSRIDPSPAGLVSVTRATVGERTLAVIGVQPSSTTWFYRRLGAKDPGTFFVREDGRTVALAGSEADNYKRSRPRS